MRKGRWPAGILTLLAVVVVACTAPGEAVRNGVKLGDRARDFNLEALDGREVALSDYKGSVVLINFWATWCPPCRAEIPGLEAAYRAHKEEGFVVLGINVEESRDAVRPFVAEMKVSYPVLLDQDGRLVKEYRVIGLPASILVDREGVIALRQMGYLSDAQVEEQLARLLPGQ